MTTYEQRLFADRSVWPREFTTTRWSLVLHAGGTDPEQAKAALEQLCRSYWFPVYAFVRRKGLDPDTAADLTQDFFCKLLANGFVEGLTQEGGRFRSFLLTALNRFLINQWQKGQRAKRGAGAAVDSIEALIAERGEASYLSEMSHADTPEKLFQRAWAEALLERVLNRLSEECTDRQDQRFSVLKPFLASGEDPPALSEAAAQLGLSLPAFKSLLHRFRQRYRELLLDEVSQTVGSRTEVAEEVRGLLQVLRGA